MGRFAPQDDSEGQNRVEFSLISNQLDGKRDLERARNRKVETRAPGSSSPISLIAKFTIGCTKELL
jgi:hypothetical protein